MGGNAAVARAKSGSGLASPAPRPAPESAPSPTPAGAFGSFYAAGPALSLGGAVQAAPAEPAAPPFAEREQRDTELAPPISAPPAPVQREVADQREEASAGPEQAERHEAPATSGPAVQSAAAGPSAGAPAASPSGAGAVQATASRGLSGASHSLPALGQLQQAFGHHDLSGVEAHVAGPARQANEQLGSRAYTRGSQIAFKEAPDLKLAAHEATHVVQQRRGIQLAGGIGRAGDPYERQADRVADAVSAGHSAEPILADRPAESRDEEARPAVQRECDGSGTCCDSCAQEQAPEAAPEEPVQQACDGSGSCCDSCAQVQQAFEAAPEEPIQRECDGSGTCCESCAQEQEAPVQRQLEVNAERLFEPPGVGVAPEAAAEAAPQAAAPAPAETPAAPEGGTTAPPGGSALEAAGPAEPATSGPAAPAPAGGGPAPAGGTQTETSGSGERATPEAGGGGINAVCFTEDWEEPAEEPEQEPPEPAATESKEEMDSESPDAEQVDVCPIEQAVEAQAGTSAPAGGVAAQAGGSGAGGAGPASGVAAGGPAAPAPAGAAATGTPGGEAATATGAAPAPEAQAMASTAAADEGAAAAAASPIEAAIGQTETQRGEAIAAYQASTARLEAYGGATSDLARDVTFASAPESDASELARGATARSRAGAFFSDAAQRMNEAIAVALGDVPDRLGGLAESTKAEIGAQIETEKQSISARIASARVSAMAAAAAARQRVQTEHDTAVASMEAETTLAVETLTTEHEAALGLVDDIETDGLDTVSTLYADSRTAHEEIGTTLGPDATNRGEEWAQAYQKCRKNSSDGFWIGWLTDRRGKAQQNASRETAKGYRKNIEKEAKKQAREAVKGRQKDRCGVIATASRARSTLDDQFDGLTTALQSGLEQARQSAAAQRDQSLASIGTALSATLRTLSQQEQSQRQAANDTGYLQQVAIEQAAHSAAASVQGSIADAVESLQRALQEIRATLAETPTPEPEALNALLNQTTAALGGSLDGLLGRVEDGTATGEQRLVDGGAQAFTALANVTSSNAEQAATVEAGFSSSMASLADGAAASFAQQAEGYAEQAQNLTTEGIAGFDQVVTGLEEAVTTLTTNVDTALADSEKKLEDALRNTLTGMDREIPKQAMKAASKEAPRWKTIVAVLLIILIVVVVALVIGPAVIGAVGAAASALGAGAAAGAIGAIVGGAIVGAATSAAIQVVNNWRTNTALSTGVGRAAIMGAIGGALGGGAGFLIGKFVTGQVAQFALNIASDVVLEVGTGLVTGELSWESLGMALLTSLATGGFGKIKGVSGIQARMQYRGARVVPGARARAYAASIRPPSPTDAGPSAPRADAEGSPATRAQEGSPARPGADQPRPATEVEGAAARTDAGPRPDADLDTPANRLSDAELASTTTQRTQVGEADHAVSFRRKGGQVECEVCSFACGNIRARIKRLGRGIPAEHTEVHDRLAALEKRVADVEGGIETATMSHRDVIEASAEIGASFRKLGEVEPTLGRAIDDPELAATAYGAPLAGRSHSSVRIDNLGVEIGATRPVDFGSHRHLGIPEGTPILYSLRDLNTGAIVKVGKTFAGSSAGDRFTLYQGAAQELGLRLGLEVTPVTGRGLRADVTDLEIALRGRLEQAGQILPWDYTPVAGSGGAGRLGRRGRGTPFEEPRATRELRDAGWDWDWGTGPQRGYLMPPGGATGVRPPRGKTTVTALAEYIREGMSNAEIARAIGASNESTVRSLRSRWKDRLAELLAE